MKCQPELIVTGNYKAIVKGGTCRFRDSSLTHAFHFCSNNSGVVCLSGHGAVYVYRQKAPVCSMSYQNQFTSPSERCTNLTVYTGCRKARESSIFPFNAAPHSGFEVDQKSCQELYISGIVVIVLKLQRSMR